MVETADVIVIGAGVQGASLAFHLARRGARVVVVERGSVAAGATGRSSGLVRMHYDLLAGRPERPRIVPLVPRLGRAGGRRLRLHDDRLLQIVGSGQGGPPPGERRGSAGDRDRDRGGDRRPDPRDRAGPRGRRRRARRLRARLGLRGPVGDGDRLHAGGPRGRGAAGPGGRGPRDRDRRRGRHRGRHEQGVVLGAGRRERGRSLGRSSRRARGCRDPGRGLASRHGLSRRAAERTRSRSRWSSTT